MLRIHSLILITFYDFKIENPPIYVSTLVRPFFTVSNSMILDFFFLQVYHSNKISLLFHVLKFYHLHYINQRPHLKHNVDLYICIYKII